SATVENCAFYGFRESTAGSHDGGCIEALNFENPREVSIRLLGNTFADSYGGIFVVGSASRKNVNVTIENNTIVGLGPLDAELAFAGIFIREGISGRIAGNTVSGFSYIGKRPDFPISFGILAAHEANFPSFGVLQHLEIEGNTLRDNQMHITLIKG